MSISKVDCSCSEEQPHATLRNFRSQWLQPLVPEQIEAAQKAHVSRMLKITYMHAIQ